MCGPWGTRGIYRLAAIWTKFHRRGLDYLPFYVVVFPSSAGRPCTETPDLWCWMLFCRCPPDCYQGVSQRAPLDLDRHTNPGILSDGGYFVVPVQLRRRWLPSKLARDRCSNCNCSGCNSWLRMGNDHGIAFDPAVLLGVPLANWLLRGSIIMD